MATMHAKSTCCRAQIYRWGSRRRRCSRCGRTWSIRSCRRGRKPRKGSQSLLEQVLVEGRSLASIAQQRHQSVPVVRYRFRSALRSLIARPRVVTLAPGPVILLADALWFRFGDQRWTLYLTALRPARHCVATFLNPILLPGKENLSGWRQAIGAIPADQLERIRAIVSDGFAGVKGIAHSHGWVLQRCHFHLIASVQARRGTRRSLPGAAVREEAYQLVRKILRLQDTSQLDTFIPRLKTLAASPTCPRRLRMILREFLRELPAFLAYRRHPKLKLPTTTNAVESMGSIIRVTTRGLSTPGALSRWATALLHLRPEITCNGANLPQK